MQHVTRATTQNNCLCDALAVTVNGVMMQLLAVAVSQYIAFVVSPSAFHSVFSLCVHADDHLRSPAANDSVFTRTISFSYFSHGPR